MSRQDPTANSTRAPSKTGQPSSTHAYDPEPHQDQHLIWLLDVIAEWLEYQASDATRAELAAFIGYPAARGTILHIIDTAARWASELDRRRSHDIPATNRAVTVPSQTQPDNPTPARECWESPCLADRDL
jgi:hypothetical protein